MPTATGLAAVSGDQQPIALLCSFSGAGGVERMMAHLARGLLRQGERVDVVLVKAKGPHLETLPLEARLVRLGDHHGSSLMPLLRYLHTSRPKVLLAAKHRGMVLAALSRLLGARTPLVGRLGTAPLASMAARNPLWRFSQRMTMRWAYDSLDAMVAVSHGVADELRAAMGSGKLPIMVLPNPVVTDAFLEAARIPCPHPWLEAAEPCLVAIGRLTPQKDIATLLEAMAQLRCHRPVRLLVLGDGPLRAGLEQHSLALGLGDVVAFLGFSPNPAAFLARASLFVLSSRWEGSPNALTEALALGCPVVATDCPHGPRELLRDGALGRLVPVGAASAMAEAILATLDAAPHPSALQQAAAPYHIDQASAAYHRLLVDVAAAARRSPGQIRK